MTLSPSIFTYIHLYLQARCMKLNDKTWNSHEWLSKPRRLATGPDDTVLHHHCVRCGRDFLTYTASNSTYAVFVSAISFDQLSDEVTKRWLGELCPGKHLSSDAEDHNRIVATLLVSQKDSSGSAAERERRR